MKRGLRGESVPPCPSPPPPCPLPPSALRFWDPLSSCAFRFFPTGKFAAAERRSACAQSLRPTQNAFGVEFRNYEDSKRQEVVQRTYTTMHTKQTVAFAKEVREKWLKFDKALVCRGDALCWPTIVPERILNTFLDARRFCRNS